MLITSTFSPEKGLDASSSGFLKYASDSLYVYCQHVFSIYTLFVFYIQYNYILLEICWF